ncbi:MAG TPA: Ig-like domain-containing protein, partial [Longimicrobiales bacterium]|nr:Ig-like domain-containing protein [Longimicrobiales bacterium]
MIRHRPLFAALAAALFAACGDSPTAPKVASVTITPGSATLPSLGATVQLSARATDDKGQVVTGREVRWNASDGTVASVSLTGLVTAVAEGTTAVTATVDGVAGSAVVTVKRCENTEPVNLDVGVSRT